MSRALAACAALLVVLVCASPASAERGTWDGVKGVKHLHFRTGPILVKPGQNSINNVVVPASTQTRSYVSSAQLIAEIANARVWGGVHFRFSTTAGTAIGIAVARFDYRHALQPVRHADARPLP